MQTPASSQRRRESLFRRASRYRRASVDPGENRLTEVFAAVSRVRIVMGSRGTYSMAGWLARLWPRSRRSVGCSAARRPAGRRNSTPNGGSWRRKPQASDLKLRFTQSEGLHAGAICAAWVEVKLSTRPHSGQLAAYSERLRRERGENGRLVLLAPRAGYPFDRAQIPDEVVQVTWEQTGRLLQQYETEDPVGRFLIDELITYLDEEGLMDPSELTAAQLTALVHYQAGRHVLARICELAGDKVDALWAEGDRPRPGRYPDRGEATEFWWSYPQEARDGETVAPAGALWPVWELLVSGAYLLADLPAGIPVFIAGVSGDPGTALDLAEPVRAELEASQFQILPAGYTKSRDHEFVLRVVPVEDLLAPGPVDNQAATLAEWVDDTFRFIARSLNADRSRDRPS